MTPDTPDGLALGRRAGGVGVVRLARPPVNAIDEALLASIAQVMEDPEPWLPGVRAIALLARGPHFSAGHERAEFGRIQEPGYLSAAADHLAGVLGCPLPVVAGVHGAAVGTGFILASCADVLIVAADAEVSLPEMHLGMLGGAGHAARWLPPAMVRHLVMTGERVSGRALHTVGVLAPRDRETAEMRALDVAAALARRPPSLLAGARAVLDGIGPDAIAVHRDEMRRNRSMLTLE